MTTHKSDLARWADQVDSYAARSVLRGNNLPTKEMLRDAADLASAGDLDCMQLDILCDMIDRRIAKWHKEASK